MRKKLWPAVMMLLITWFALAGCDTAPCAYGVFLGINGDETEKLKSYQTVVIEPEEFTSEQIQELHRQGKTIYAYLNVGAMEHTRTYDETYKAFALGIYEDWPDEVWMDTSQEAWQAFIVNDLAKKYAEQGYDGFFIDNTDVYYHFPRQEIYQGLIAILQGLHQYEADVILNGGDFFVSKMIEEKEHMDLWTGINQESVFTSIDFETKTYGRQAPEDTAYFQAYLQQVKDEGKAVYLLEYGATDELQQTIHAYCEGNGWVYFISPDLTLTRDM